MESEAIKDKIIRDNEAIKDKTNRDIKILFEEEDDYYKPIRVGDFWNNNYIEYESNGGRNKKPSIKEHLNEIKSYLKDIITNLQKSGTWKVQLKIAINFMSSE